MSHKIICVNDKTINIELVRGDTFIVDLSFKKNDTEYEPEEGDTATFTVRKNYKGLNNDEVLIFKVLDLSQTTELELEPIDTEEMDYGSYKYDIEFNYADGRRDTPLRGSFKLTREVT